MKKVVLMVDVFTTELPKSIQRLDSKSFYYRYDIKSTNRLIDGKDLPGFMHNDLYVEGDLTQSEIMRSWLSSVYPMDQELKLLNDFNAFTSGITSDVTKKEEYETYLERRKDFREQLAIDFETYMSDQL